MEKNGEIQIRSAEICARGERTRLTYTVCCGEERFEIYYEVERAYGGDLCGEVADGAVVMMLPFAMRGGYDIVSEVPLSKDLYDKLTGEMIPQAVRESRDIYATDIRCACIEPDYAPKDVATAMSCGVDSLTTFYEHTVDCTDPEQRLTMLTFFQNGAHHCGTIGHDAREGELFERQLAHVAAFCEKIGFPLLAVRSNIDEILSRLFWPDSYQMTHSFRNAGFALLLQKRIRLYYYAPAYEKARPMDLNGEDTAAYEQGLFPYLSTGATTIENAKTNKIRLEKIAYIAQHPETHDSLLVCYRDDSNCGVCVKCRRTLVEMDFVGVLEQYAASFDIEKYRNRRSRFIIEVYAHCRRSEQSRQIAAYARENDVELPAFCEALGALRETAALGICRINDIRRARKRREKRHG